MYCVIGEKILKCEVSEKLENYSWVRIGKTEKGQTIPNNRIFETDTAARDFIQRRDKRKSDSNKEMTDEIHACKRMYDAFLKETGIMVRIIDRRFKLAEVEKQLAHLRKKYDKSEDAKTGNKVPKDSRAYSTKPSSSFKTKSEPTDRPANKYDKKLGHKFSKMAPKSGSGFGSKSNGTSNNSPSTSTDNRSKNHSSKRSNSPSTGSSRGKSSHKSTNRNYK